MTRISFVVQGPVLKDSNSAQGVFSTFDALTSIRTFYPDAEIILSTWKGTEVTGLDYDRLILNDDPGSITVPGIANPYNHNRILVSTKNGIIEASNDVVVKTRTDIIFKNSNITNTVKFITPTNSPYSIFNNYVLSTNYYVRNPCRLNLLFHASDIILIGKKADLLLFFSAPVVSRDEIVYNERIRMVAEQYLTVNSLRVKKNKKYKFERTDRTNVRYFMESEKYLFNSFIFFSIEEFGIEFPKKLFFAFRPEANYSIDEIDTLSTKYKKSRVLDIFSYRRATRYLIERLKDYVQRTPPAFLKIHK